MTLADSIFQAAVADLRRRYPQPHRIEIGPEVRELIIARLLEHQLVVYAEPAKCYDLVEDCLIALGVTNAELLANLQRADE